MKIKTVKEKEEEPTAKELIEALRASGKRLEVNSIPEPVGFGSGLDDYPPRIDVGQVTLEETEYTLTVVDLIKIINQIVEQIVEQK